MSLKTLQVRSHVTFATERSAIQPAISVTGRFILRQVCPDILPNGVKWERIHNLMPEI